MPFLRLLLPLMAGIILQWYVQMPVNIPATVLGFAWIILMIFLLAGKYWHFRFAWVQGICIHLAMATLGMLLVFVHDIRNYKNWFGRDYKQGDVVEASLTEQPVLKQNAYKAEANIVSIARNDSLFTTRGKMIIYFKKDSAIAQYTPGTRLLLKRTLQEIKNNGNPGAFDYRRYALLKGITHQVYVNRADYQLTGENDNTRLQQFLFRTRNYVLGVLRENIRGQKERGLAEALLIGYKDDLDKNLLQSYGNTGVVHIIAVSGMHLALLYWLLNLLFQPLLLKRKTKWLHPLLVIITLWLFSLITGGAASIIRAAVMFTFIKLGKTISRNASVYNILAASAFCLLCYNPFWLWDVGFRLSYAAVLSIVIFYKPIYHLLFVENKVLNACWQLVAVSISAQILTTPLSVYYFHQFPVYFIITNFMAVPLSSFILVGAFLLVLISPLVAVALVFGSLLEKLVWWLNRFIETIERFPFASWGGLQINAPQVLMAYAAIICISLWLLQRRKATLQAGLLCIVLLLAIRLDSFYNAQKQYRLIVYNTSKNTAIEFIEGRHAALLADSGVVNNPNLLKPSGILQRLKPSGPPNDFYKTGNAVRFANKKIILINTPINRNADTLPIYADLVILSHNPKLYINDLNHHVKTKQVVIDASVPSWKAKYWRRDCDSLGIACHDVSQDGAFVMELN